MKKSSLLLAILSTLLLSSCQSGGVSSSTPTNSGGNGGTTEPGTGGNTDPGTGGNTGGNTDHGTGGSSTQIDDDPEVGEETWQQGRVKLPNYSDGYELYSCGKPINYDNPVSLPTTYNNTSDQWLTGDWSSSIPDDWIYTYGNSYSNGPTGHYTGEPNWYPSNDGYGAKFTKANQGFCTPRFTHTGEKLELRFTISTVRDANGTATVNAKPIKIYFFSGDNKVIGMWESAADVITKNTTQVKLYWTTRASEVEWFEFRLANQAHKNSQNYNFGLKDVNIKSWPQA